MSDAPEPEHQADQAAPAGLWAILERAAAASGEGEFRISEDDYRDLERMVLRPAAEKFLGRAREENDEEIRELIQMGIPVIAKILPQLVKHDAISSALQNERDRQAKSYLARALKHEFLKTSEDPLSALLRDRLNRAMADERFARAGSGPAMTVSPKTRPGAALFSFERIGNLAERIGRMTPTGESKVLPFPIPTAGELALMIQRAVQITDCSFTREQLAELARKVFALRPLKEIRLDQPSPFPDNPARTQAELISEEDSEDVCLAAHSGAPLLEGEVAAARDAILQVLEELDSKPANREKRPFRNGFTLLWLWEHSHEPQGGVKITQSLFAKKTGVPDATWESRRKKFYEALRLRLRAGGWGDEEITAAFGCLMAEFAKEFRKFWQAPSCEKEDAATGSQ